MARKLLIVSITDDVVIDLSARGVFLVEDDKDVDDKVELGINRGIRLDNYNVGNCFFGSVDA